MNICTYEHIFIWRCTTVLYAIKFHATVFHLNICSYVHTLVIWIYAHMNIRSFEKHMNNCSCIHLWQKCMLEHMNNHSYMQMVVYNLIVRSRRIYRVERHSQLSCGLWWCLLYTHKRDTYVHRYRQTPKSDKTHMS